MSKTSIQILISQEAPKRVSPHYQKPPLCSKVKEAIKRVESTNNDSESEWKYLKHLYEVLSKKKNLTEEQLEILDSLEDVMEKFSNHDHDEAVEIDAQRMHRGKGA